MPIAVFFGGGLMVFFSSWLTVKSRWSYTGLADGFEGGGGDSEKLKKYASCMSDACPLG